MQNTSLDMGYTSLKCPPELFLNNINVCGPIRTHTKIKFALQQKLLAIPFRTYTYYKIIDTLKYIPVYKEYEFIS